LVKRSAWGDGEAALGASVIRRCEDLRDSAGLRAPTCARARIGRQRRYERSTIFITSSCLCMNMS
jgi:hypothetical protein